MVKMGTGYQNDRQTRERGIYGSRMGYCKSMSKSNCKHCGVEFTPTRGAKGIFCSSKCRDAFNSQRWESFKHCIKCHASLGLTGAASGRLIGIEKSKVSLIKKKYKIKALNNSEAQIAKNAHKNIRADLRCDWNTWWGGRDNAKLWMTEYKPKENWHNHPEINRHRCREYQRTMHAASGSGDPFRLKKIVRCRVYNSIKRLLRGAKPRMRYRTEEMLGCTVEQFKEYIEGIWANGMNWDNYGSQWEIDHTIPLASFNMADPHHQKMATHYTNQGPMWKKENRRKSDKILDDVQPELPMTAPH